MGKNIHEINVLINVAEMLLCDYADVTGIVDAGRQPGPGPVVSLSGTIFI